MPSSACKKCARSEEHTSELQSHDNIVCRLLLEKKTVRWAVGPLRIPSPAQLQPSKESSLNCMPCDRAIGPAARKITSFFFNYRGSTEIYSFSPPVALPT